MDPRVATILRFTVWGLIFFFLFVFGSKHYKKFARKEVLVSEMRSLVSDSSFYRSLTAKDAQTALLRSVALIDEAKSLGLEPTLYFDQVFKRESGKSLISGEFEDYPARERLARETLMRAYQHAGQFQLLDKPENRELLAKGEFPEMEPKPVIACIIDPAVSPGMEKIVPNLELKPPGTPVAEPTDLEIAAAKNLATDLCSANVIEYEAEKRILAHYVKPAVKPAKPVEEKKVEEKKADEKPVEEKPAEETKE
jgi:hypothetical protein